MEVNSSGNGLNSYIRRTVQKYSKKYSLTNRYDKKTSDKNITKEQKKEKLRNMIVCF